MGTSPSPFPCSDTLPVQCPALLPEVLPGVLPGVLPRGSRVGGGEGSEGVGGQLFSSSKLF